MDNNFKKKKKDYGGYDSPTLGISGLIDANLYLKRNRLLYKVFGRKSELLDYIAAHIDAGIYHEFKGVKYFYKTAKEIAEYFDLSCTYIEETLRHFRELGILSVEHLNKHYRVNYYTINSDVLRSFCENFIQNNRKKFYPDEEGEGNALDGDLNAHTRPPEPRDAVLDSEVAEGGADDDWPIINEGEPGYDEFISTVRAANRVLGAFNASFEDYGMGEYFDRKTYKQYKNYAAAFKAKFQGREDLVERYMQTLEKAGVRKPLDEVVSYRFIDKWMASITEQKDWRK